MEYIRDGNPPNSKHNGHWLYAHKESKTHTKQIREQQEEFAKKAWKKKKYIYKRILQKKSEMMDFWVNSTRST